MKRLLAIELLEEGMIDLVRFNRSKAELKLFKHVDPFLVVYQLDRWDTITRCLAPRFSCERASCQNDALIRAASRSSTKVTHVRKGDRLAEALALEQNLEETSEFTERVPYSTTSSRLPDPPSSRSASSRGPKYRTNWASSTGLCCFALAIAVLTSILT